MKINPQNGIPIFPAGGFDMDSWEHEHLLELCHSCYATGLIRGSECGNCYGTGVWMPFYEGVDLSGLTCPNHHSCTSHTRKTDATEFQQSVRLTAASLGRLAAQATSGGSGSIPAPSPDGSHSRPW